MHSSILLYTHNLIVIQIALSKVFAQDRLFTTETFSYPSLLTTTTTITGTTTG